MWAAIKSFHEVVWLRFGAGAMPWRLRMFPTAGRTSSDPNWPALRRCGHIPSQYSHVPFAPPKLPRPVQRWPAWILSVFGTIELLGHEPSIPSQDGVGLGDAGEPSRSALRPHASRSRRGWRARITQPQSGWQLRLRIRFSAARYSFAGEAPGSPIPSRTLAAATTSCSSCRLPILLWPLVV